MMNAIRMMLAQGRLAAPAATQGEGDVAFAWDGATVTVTDSVSGHTRLIRHITGRVG